MHSTCGARSRRGSTLTERRGPQTAVRLLRLLEETGNWGAVARLLEAEQEAIQAASNEFSGELQEMRHRLVAAQRHEDVNGRGSLLRQDHPIVMTALRWVAEKQVKLSK